METLLPRLQRSRARQRSRAEQSARAATPRGQQPFTVVAPLLRAGLLLGAAGGFVLASVLSLSLALRQPLGAWWLAVAQAHGHLQVYGWAGLFVTGVAFHFLPRLRGAPLAWSRTVPWLVAALVAALVLRGVSQPLLVVAAGGSAGAWAALWRVLLVVSGVLEAAGFASVLVVLGETALRRGAPAFRARPALWSVWPFLLCAVGSLGLAALLNLLNVFGAAGTGGGIVPPSGDAANVLLGLFGFLVPMALAMSARALPMYAGLDAFPRRVLWPAALAYAAGLLLVLLGELGTGGNLASSVLLGRLGGLGLALMGGVLVAFIALFGRLMAGRGRLPQRVRSLAPSPEQAARGYVRHVTNERATFGPYVALIGSAYGWALLAGLLLLLDGIALALGAGTPVTLDAPRHSLAVGFIALLLAGVSARMIPGFSGGHIASPRWVVALLWLGNAAALLRVGSLLAQPALAALGAGGSALDSALFGLSGPLGLAFAICLAINVWPALAPRADSRSRAR
ncbi:MAG TPA: hypothetical protein VF116_15520 [Ktedonobacterales bacterium]